MVEGVANHAIDQSRGFDRLQTALVLSLKFGLANENRDQRRATDHNVVGCQCRCALALANAVGMVLKPAQQSGAETRLMCAPVWGRDGVAIRMNEAVIAREPCDRPFDGAMLACFFDAAGEDLVGHEFLTLDIRGEIVS